MKELLNYSLLNNPVRDWLIAIGIIVLAVACLRIFQAVIIKKLRVFSARTKTSIDDFIFIALQRSVMPMLYVLAVYLSMQYLVLSDRVRSVGRIAVMVVVTFFVLRMISAFIAYAFKQALQKQEYNAQRQKQSRGMLVIIQIIVWLIGLLFLVDNLGYNITTLVAGLGIGGIAIALAAQTILGDLFSYFVIFFDKPFEIGDFIIIDNKMGTVEYIGIKTTRIRTLEGEQLVCSNTDLTNSRVHNYKRMQDRRVVFSFGVIYDTTADQLKSIPVMVKEIISAIEHTRFDRAHFKSFGNSSLDFEVVYYVQSPDFNLYMDLQQTINMRLFELFGKEGIIFAFPTQTLYLHRNDQNNNANRSDIPASSQ